MRNSSYIFLLDILFPTRLTVQIKTYCFDNFTAFETFLRRISRYTLQDTWIAKIKYHNIGNIALYNIKYVF